MKRFLKLREFLKWASLVILVLFLGGWAFENWRGAKALGRAKERAEQAGVSLLRADYTGPDIPDEENLLKDLVFLKEFENEGEGRLESWQQLPEVDRKGISTRNNPATGEVLEYAKYFKEELNQDEARIRLAEVARDFESRLDLLSKTILDQPVHAIFTKLVSENPFSEKGKGMMMPTFKVAHCLRSSAIMALRSGDAKTALTRVRVLERLAEISGKPAISHFLTGKMLWLINAELIWEGLRLRSWSDRELETLSRILSSRTLRDDFLEMLKFEMAMGLESIGTEEEIKMKKSLLAVFGSERTLFESLEAWFAFHGPSGWLDRRKANHLDISLEFIGKVSGHDDVELPSRKLERVWSPTEKIEQFFASGLELAVRKYEELESAKRMTLLAIALERHFLAHQSYPDSLAELDLEFEATDFTDPGRRDLIYELGPDGRPVIFSKYEEETMENPSRRRLRWQYYQVK